MKTKRFALAALLCVSALATTAGAAQASKTQESILQDDRVLVSSGPGTQTAALDQLQGLGVDTIHSLVFWNKIAPSSDASKKPSFDASNPAAYPAGAWDAYDDLVRGAKARGIDLILTPTGKSPTWANGCRGKANCQPSAKEFGAFVKAVAKRYSGSYHDENQGGGTLPKVGRWSLWNEPEQGGWLFPQRKSGVVFSAKIYRELYTAGYSALKATGHGRDKIYIGETAPVRGGVATGPVEFLQALFCIDKNGRKLTGKAAKTLGCTKYKTLKFTAVAHHPYNRGAGGPPLKKPKSSGDITLATLDRLFAVLKQAKRAHRISGSTSSVYFTEYGIQSKPPERTSFGVPLTKHAEQLNQAEFVGYKDSRVKSFSQYELFDEPVVTTFNTGLLFANGTAKPALAAYRLPIYAVKSGSKVKIWGAVRSGSGSRSVDILAGGKKVKTVTVRGVGYFTTTVSKASSYQLSATIGGQTFTSRVAKAASS
jgi:hypothetical protein